MTLKKDFTMIDVNLVLQQGLLCKLLAKHIVLDKPVQGQSLE